MDLIKFIEEKILYYDKSSKVNRDEYIKHNTSGGNPHKADFYSMNSRDDENASRILRNIIKEWKGDK